MMERARRDNKQWGVGLRPATPQGTERHVVTVPTYEHLKDWIFSNELLEPTKASEQAIQRGHCFAVKEALSATFPRYQQSADKAGVPPVPERIYRYPSP